MLKTFEDRYVGLEHEVLCEDRSSVSQKLQTIYESVVDAPATMSPEEIRYQSCEAFVELFEGTDHLVSGEGHLPEEPGHIFIMNHLSNHPANLLPNGFIPTLDTHFVSAMILLKKYGDAPVRVVRRSNPDEDAHRRFYDRLGYIYVYSRCMNPAEYGSGATPEDRRRLFLNVAREHLKDGRNVVVCPEGISTGTENSPLPLKAGAFSLAAYVRPEPLLVPIAVANFDKQITHTRMVAVVHEPIRLSEPLGEVFGDDSLHRVINDYVYERVRGYVREAVQLAG
jgi:hypothetical protein